MLRDIRFALKLLWKDRGFTATAILTLAVCVGSNTAIFTIVNSTLLRPLGAPGADRILIMSNQYPKAGVTAQVSTNSGVPDYYDRLRDAKAFDEQALYNSSSQTIEIDDVPERVRGMNATPSLFRLLRAAPALGRAFDESEGEIGAEQKIIFERRAVAPTVRRRQDRPRTRPSPLGPHLHHCGRHAARLLVCRFRDPLLDPVVALGQE